MKRFVHFTAGIDEKDWQKEVYLTHRGKIYRYYRHGKEDDFPYCPLWGRFAECGAWCRVCPYADAFLFKRVSDPLAGLLGKPPREEWLFISPLREVKEIPEKEFSKESVKGYKIRKRKEVIRNDGVKARDG
jgi:hypothetical protein